MTVRIPRTLVPIALSLLLASCAAGRTAGKAGPGMPYPPPSPPKVEEIHHLPTGLRLSIDGLMEMLSGARLVSVGETHDNLHDQRVELAVIRGLHERFPGRVAIGMEMFRAPQQAVLDRWTRGELSELDFLKASKWYDTWGYDFGAYRDILLYARDRRIDVIALNPSKELQEEVRAKGLDNVPEETRVKLPEIDDSDPYQRAVLEGVFGGHGASRGGKDAFASFYRVQLLWEETMAQRIVDYLKSPRGEGKRIVTITGGWHVTYGFGLPKKVVRRMPMAYAVVLPEEISTDEEKEGRLMDVELPDVPLLPAQFRWYVPFESLESKRVRMGILMEEKEGRLVVRSVVEGSPAGKAGIAAGDVLVAIDGRPVMESVDVHYILGDKRDGDTADVSFRRGGEERTLPLTFFRMPKPKAH
ncbi:MAG: PDZ domain-containing protein [Deltaproteobacteria bacterium]|nr:MAG: PDZ domain-containing protein [Deltaproteobacteria bacterium]